ncbi:unnamed protein product [Ambrosiozyma monospora]|uniref:Unnamed protein product n=1 Tax=Ambrosiozyma monospora TaxID=43982 RepID=A0ACB5U2L4_AMBMO|nr:unnamed protein product [Ambrosiozyma monospora]
MIELEVLMQLEKKSRSGEKLRWGFVEVMNLMMISAVRHSESQNHLPSPKPTIDVIFRLAEAIAIIDVSTRRIQLDRSRYLTPSGCVKLMVGLAIKSS